ncbi:MAG: thioredoxin domain-containing protein [Chloroflexota bacterium]|nr:thioredoxin domain-containing protein [Chloroflexota bacterium]
MPNRLAAESSPYLLQHQHNPVDWYPWGDQAFAAARATGKPIFLSVGYAACHWCHVMERESFEDQATADVLNQHFISVKVDREERPDVDQIYMSAVQLLTRHGGWPMSVFMTPDGKPFHGGTYFPPEPRHGMPSFQQVLTAVNDAWTNRRDELESGAARLTDAIQAADSLDLPSAPVSDDDLRRASQALAGSEDRTNGGWGQAPKFPQAMAIEFLLRRHLATGEGLLLDIADRALHRMARGGIYDHVGGGFHRYSVDAAWHVPHFEKMLYDNSQLARVYLHAWQIGGDPAHRRVVEETLDWVRREMTHPQGGFFSTLDADSEGEEGKFYVWSLDEVRDVLGADADLVAATYDVSAGGNWEGVNVLRRLKDLDVLAYQHDASVEDIQAAADRALPRLFERRADRVRPGLDDKIITAWNGLMIAAFAEAGRALERDDYTAVAMAAADFCCTELWRDMNRLARTWKDGRARFNAYLEDYACLAEGLLELYQTTFDDRWFIAARELSDAMLQHFQDPEGGFFDTSNDHETLVTRPKNVQDNATPSGGSMAITVLGRMHALTGEARYLEAAERALSAVGPGAASYPTAFAQWFSAADFLVGEPAGIAVVGDGSERDDLLGVVRETYRPRTVVATALDGDGAGIPLLQGRQSLDGRAAAFVCHGFVCKLPTSDPRVVRQLLAAD